MWKANGPRCDSIWPPRAACALICLNWWESAGATKDLFVVCVRVDASPAYVRCFFVCFFVICFCFCFSRVHAPEIRSVCADETEDPRGPSAARASRNKTKKNVRINKRIYETPDVTGCDVLSFWLDATANRLPSLVKSREVEERMSCDENDEWKRRRSLGWVVRASEDDDSIRNWMTFSNRDQHENGTEGFSPTGSKLFMFYI